MFGLGGFQKRHVGCDPGLLEMADWSWGCFLPSECTGLVMRGEQIAAVASHVWPRPLLALIYYKTQTSFLNMVLQGRNSPCSLLQRTQWIQRPWIEVYTQAFSFAQCRNMDGVLFQCPHQLITWTFPVNMNFEVWNTKHLFLTFFIFWK